jgi:hypothetical protein
MVRYHYDREGNYTGKSLNQEEYEDQFDHSTSSTSDVPLVTWVVGGCVLWVIATGVLFLLAQAVISVWTRKEFSETTGLAFWIAAVLAAVLTVHLCIEGSKKE